MTLARRQLLQFGLAAGATSTVGVAALGPQERMARLGARAVMGATQAVQTVEQSVLWPTRMLERRRAFLHNLHTGETLDAVYFENGRYVPDALAQAMRVLRDWRNGQEHVMDPRLFDVLHAIHAKLGASVPFQIISGYRSPETNAMMHARSPGVASNSQHMQGKASDIRLQGVELGDLHKAALSLDAGGVGLYPVSNFVHVDVATVRHWTGV
ncbi:DUF882 domain-containing protein [Caulobacter sp. S45]|uniref:DUF882 domain-containing protein n=1 Tax=Caulobacter sp. S45 TaxID=1641861 RepID=UPI0020C64B00|nr:DUF882 domain-containing protein [Caulobacter sp. S45]